MAAPSLSHLVRRFAGSLWPVGPKPADATWADERLLAGERELWRRMSRTDRRHAAGVARRVERSLGPDATRPVLAAALLHDVGKTVSGLGTWGRVVATLVGAVRGRVRPGGAIGDYLRHADLGAALLAEAGSDPLTVAWAREHHLTRHEWTVDVRIAGALKAADDD
ncbi:MAG: HD domain-containing protein [Actinobacteria bacterium]|nr:MAG: HD domain-containing protein [Actinomycetota bacterium]